MSDTTPDLKLTRYLIHSCYGWTGNVEKGFFDLNSGGLVIWNIWSDGTIEGLHKSFINAQINSNDVKNFNELADDRGLPRSYGMWKIFSVIEKFDDQDLIKGAIECDSFSTANNRSSVPPMKFTENPIKL